MHNIVMINKQFHDFSASIIYIKKNPGEKRSLSLDITNIGLFKGKFNYILYVGYLMTLPVARTISPQMTGQLMNNKLERIRKKTVVV
jgi:hypothetical protein